MPEINAEKLRHIVNPEEIEFETTKEVTPLTGTIGQERAVHAIDFSLKVKTKGYNLYVSGPLGTGKHSTIDAFVRDIAKDQPVPSDWCYVYNFEKQDEPIAIELPSGAAPMLAHDINELIETCKSEIPRAFESEEYESRKNSVVTGFQANRDRLIGDLRRKAESLGFSVEMTAAGIFTFPVIDGKPLKHDEFDKLPAGERERVQKSTDELQVDINHLLTEVRNLEKQAKDELMALDREIALFAVGHLLETLMEKYKHLGKVNDYLAAVQSDIVENLDLFRSEEKKGEMMIPGLEIGGSESRLDRYSVNVFISNTGAKGAPIVFESNPSYYNLFGRLEYRAQLGAMNTDFTMVKAGAIHQANGGFLIINALELLINPFSWDALKRTLEDAEARIENIGEQFRMIPAATLKPEPIPLDLKVILIGNPMIYNILYQLDEDFRKLFKIKADFNWEMDRNKEHIEKYAAFIASRCANDHGCKHFDRTGVARIIEYSSRLADYQKKLSTRFIEIDDLISEASYWASLENAEYVRGEHVQKAIEEKIFRSNMIEQKLQEMIDDGTIMIDTEGAAVGQVNGLSVYELGDYAFGRPSRITCRTHIGRGGVVNIEREVKLGGPIHNKGVMILAGYLGGKYAGDRPLTMSATVCFEQIYGEVEGDSASSTELYSILSSLSDLPIRQGIAVTGSVNQNGEIQPIGGVNQKVEGFFDVCKAKGLTGEQGVLIPHQNIENLMLRDEVVESVRDSRFHVWAVKTIDEGIELLTGVPAGVLLPDGSYDKDTVNYLVHARLDDYADKIREFNARPVNHDEDNREQQAAA